MPYKRASGCADLVEPGYLGTGHAHDGGTRVRASKRASPARPSTCRCAVVHALARRARPVLVLAAHIGMAVRAACAAAMSRSFTSA
jgi:hypothetical protein